MSSNIETGAKKPAIEECCKKPVLMGIRGEDLVQYGIRPARTDSNGAKEAPKAQQF